MATIDIQIDDKPLKISPGMTILDACRENGIDIPTMCHLEGLSDVGACRLCLVEIEGVKKLQSSCTTKVTPNMVSDSEREAEKISPHHHGIVLRRTESFLRSMCGQWQLRAAGPGL